MDYSERDRASARQDFLEEILRGGSACAPMPGTFMEMLEIAAAERLQSAGGGTRRTWPDDAPLTLAANDSRMASRWSGLIKTADNVASWFRAGPVARRLPL